MIEFILILSNFSDEIRNNKDIVIIGLNNYSKDFKYIGEKLRNDKDVAIATLNSKNRSVKRSYNYNYSILNFLWI